MKGYPKPESPENGISSKDMKIVDVFISLF